MSTAADLLRQAFGTLNISLIQQATDHIRTATAYFQTARNLLG